MKKLLIYMALVMTTATLNAQNNKNYKRTTTKARTTTVQKNSSSAKINSLLKDYKEAIDFGMETPCGGGGWTRAMDSAIYCKDKLKAYVSKMTQQQKTQYNQLNKRFVKLQNCNY